MGEEGDGEQIAVSSNGASLAGRLDGEGTQVVVLHGLTATRRYVLHGSRRLVRSGHRVAAYDARGHGESGRPGSSEAYEYADLVGDLEAVIDSLGVDTAVLVGNSMGAHTAAAFALAHPERVAALALVTPAFAGEASSPEELDRWDRLAVGLRQGGVDGFLDAYRPPVAADYRETVITFTRQRLERHRDLDAVADAITVVPRSVPFDGLDALRGIELPTLVVGSRDDADPGHPLAVAESWAERIAGAETLVEDEGRSPLAWQGSSLSRAIADFLERRCVERKAYS